MRKSLGRWVAAVLAIATMTAGCGGGGDESSPDASTTTTAAPAATTTVAPAFNPAADTAHAEGLVLKASDMPAGWTRDLSDPEDVAKTQELERKLGACTGDQDPAASISARFDGEGFSSGDNSISSVGVLYKDANTVKEGLASARDPKNYPCVGNVITEFFKQTFVDEGVTGVSVSSQVSSLDTIAVADDGFALRIKTSMTGPGGTANIYMDLIGFIKDRAESSVLVTYVTGAPPVALERELLAKLRARADTATII